LALAVILLGKRQLSFDARQVRQGKVFIGEKLQREAQGLLNRFLLVLIYQSKIFIRI
jgi:hypothetical protein